MSKNASSTVRATTKIAAMTGNSTAGTIPSPDRIALPAQA